MSKSFIPYHLRQNKAIDRNLFVETLHAINRAIPIRKYEYISMGGPFLEDFKVIHSTTGIDRMISFEMDSNTYIRQKFNRPLSCIRLKHKTSTEFIRDHFFEKPSIIWLDFTTPSRLSSDLNDVFDLVAKLKHGDILKVTLNAHAASIPHDRAGSEIEKPLKRFEYLEKQLGDYLPESVEADWITTAKYPIALCRILELVIDRAFPGQSKEYFQPLTAFIYADGQRMLTFTGIVLDKDESNEFFKNTGLGDWDLGYVRQGRPVSISVPDLSIKERMLLDSWLPNYSSTTIQKRLKYLVAEDDSNSAEGIENYVRYYKQFPYYTKVIL